LSKQKYLYAIVYPISRAPRGDSLNCYRLFSTKEQAEQLLAHIDNERLRQLKLETIPLDMDIVGKKLYCRIGDKDLLVRMSIPNVALGFNPTHKNWKFK